MAQGGEQRYLEVTQPPKEPSATLSPTATSALPERGRDHAWLRVAGALLGLGGFPWTVHADAEGLLSPAFLTHPWVLTVLFQLCHRHQVSL